MIHLHDFIHFVTSVMCPKGKIHFSQDSTCLLPSLHLLVAIAHLTHSTLCQQDEHYQVHSDRTMHRAPLLFVSPREKLHLTFFSLSLPNLPSGINGPPEV